MFKDLSRRMATSSIFIGLVVCMIVFAFNDWFQYFVATLISLLTAVAIWEYEQFAKAKGGKMILPALIGFGFAIVFSFYLASRHVPWPLLPLALFFLAMLTLFALHFKEKEGAIVDLSISTFGLVYIAVPMGMVLGVLYTLHADGRWWVAYLLIVTKITDIGAYFAGNLFGKRKLAPQISPGKTVEGAIVGLLCAILASYGFYLLGQSVSPAYFQLGLIESLLLGTVLGIAGQFGDLSESLLKRDANKKDSNSLPGLGGALDAIDSLLLNSPIIYLYLSIATQGMNR